MATKNGGNDETSPAAEAMLVTDNGGNGEDGGTPMWVGVASGVAIGLLVGGALGLLFAPKSGQELRGDLSTGLDGVRDRTEQLVDELQESAARLAERSRTALDQTRDNITRSVEAGREAYAQKRQELTAQLESQIRFGSASEPKTTDEAGV